MMRCIGMSKRQVIRFVRLEAFNWCRTAVPIGLVLGTLVSWTICAALRYGIGGEFAATPVWQLSPAGLCAGAVVGVVTVLLAAQAPGKAGGKGLADGGGLRQHPECAGWAVRPMPERAGWNWHWASAMPPPAKRTGP